MATDWLHRINIIAPEADKEALNAIWTVVAPGGNSEADTFGVPLSANGEEPATHRGVSTAATDEMSLLITDSLAEELASCIIEISPHYINEWQAFLDTNGMQVIQPEEI